MAENKPLDPVTLCLGIMVEASLEVSSKLNKLVFKYESDGIDTIPVSELKNILAEGMKKTMEDGSFTKFLLREGLND